MTYCCYCIFFLLNGLAGACPKGEVRLAVAAAAALDYRFGDIVLRRLIRPGAVLRLAAVKSEVVVYDVIGEIAKLLSNSAESNVATLSFIRFAIPLIYNRISSTLSSVPYSASLIPFRARF